MIEDKKSFYRNVMALVLPMAVQNLINVGISSTDVIMLGMVDEKVLSGASLGSQVQFVLSLILFGITSGASVLVAQYWGRGETKTIEKVMGLSIKISMTVGMAFFAVTLIMPENIMGILTNDKEVIREGTKYLKLVSFTYILMSFNIVYLNIMRSVEKVTISTVVYLVGLITNVIVNAILIFGPLKLGATGAAIGTVVAMTIEFLIIVYYDRRKNNIIPLSKRCFERVSSEIRNDFIRISGPVILNEMMWGLGGSVIAAILGHLGSDVVAANSVTQVVKQLAMVVSFGVANATAIILGKTIGEGNEVLAREYGKRFVKISIYSGIISSIVVLLVRPIAINIMDFNGSARVYLSLMMFVMAYYVIGQAFNTTLIVGVFRSGGDTKIGLAIDMGFLWGIAIVAGYLAAEVFNLPVMIVYIILMSDEILKIPVCIWRYKKYIWLKNVTRETEEKI